MYTDPNTTGAPMNQQFAEGTPVYDVSGDKVGTVSDYNPQGGYFILRKGLIFPRDIYVPLDALSGRSADGLQLGITKDELNSKNWDQPPATPTSGRSYMSGASADTTSTQTGQRSSEGDVRVPLREEEIVAQKQRQEQGRVRLHKDVAEEQQQVNVPVTHEEVKVERAPVQGQPDDLGPDAFTEKDIDVPVMGEQVSAQKQGKTAEEVRIKKQPVTEQQQVSDTVRKERLKVEGADDQGQLRDTGRQDQWADTETQDQETPSTP